jgi:hypothetical protein
VYPSPYNIRLIYRVQPYTVVHIYSLVGALPQNLHLAITRWISEYSQYLQPYLSEFDIEEYKDSDQNYTNLPHVSPPYHTYFTLLETNWKSSPSAMDTHQFQQFMDSILAQQQTQQDTLNALGQASANTATAIQTLSTAVAGLATATCPNTSVSVTGHTVEMSEKCEGVCSTMAQTFLTSFGIWAMSLGSKMNNLDASRAYQSWKDKEHVVSALTFMRGPASI